MVNTSLRLLSLLAAAFSLITASAQTPIDYKIEGRVFDDSNRGVEKVRVCALSADYAQAPWMHCPLSDSEGRFVIRPGRAARFRILPEKSSAGYHWQQTEFYRNPLLPLLEVTLDETNPSATISVPLGQKNGAFTGRVTDATTGLAVENVRFSMCHVSNPRVCGGNIIKNTAGAFDIAAPHVPFTLKISAEGYEDWWAPDGLGKNNPLNIPSGTKLELLCLLRRKPEAADLPLSEAEKNRLVNLPAPMQVSPADRAEFREVPRHTTLEWKPVEGAAYYFVEIDFCDGRDRDVRECVDPKPFSMNRLVGPFRVQGTDYEFNFVGRQPGRWRVWAIDSQGREGFKSPWRIIFYLK